MTVVLLSGRPASPPRSSAARAWPVGLRAVRIRAVLALALAALLLGCGERTPGTGPAGAPAVAPAAGPSVVLVLVDQLRLDSMERWAPHLAALAQQGVSAGQMRSVAPWTYPSVLSLMSGLYPQQHNAGGDMFKNVLTTFDPGLPLLPDLLRRHGYATAAFVTNPFLQTWNPFHTAFDHYDVDFIGSQGNLRGKGKLVWKGGMFADTVNAAIKEYFDATPLGAAEFTYIHYIDVHGPWDDAPFADDYESAIRWTDDKVVEMYDYFTQRYDGNVLFVVTADHGRGLDDDETVGEGERWRVSKKSVYDFNLRIPFALLPSRVVTGPRRLTDWCSNVDVVPTLLDWLGIEADWELPGASLMPLIRGEADALPARALYSRNSSFKKLNECVVYEGRKYLRHYNPHTHKAIATSVFDLTADPRELISLGDDFGAAAPIFEAARGTHGLVFKASFEAPPDDVLRNLQGLGYMGGNDDDTSDDDGR